MAVSTVSHLTTHWPKSDSSQGQGYAWLYSTLYLVAGADQHVPNCSNMNRISQYETCLTKFRWIWS